MSLAGALNRLLSRRSRKGRDQAAVTLGAIRRAAMPVIDQLESRRMLTVTPTYPTIAVAGGLTQTAPITYQDSTPSTSDGTDFGNVDIKKSVVETFAIRNGGQGILNLTAFNRVQVTGANAADFTVVAQPAVSVLPGGKTLFSVKFAPTTTAAEHATVEIFNDTAGQDPFTFDVQGTGTSASKVQVVGLGKVINNNDTILSALDGTDFGSAESANGSVSHTFTIKNLGSATLNFSGSKVSVTGTDAAAFTVTTPPPATLAVGASADIVVKFAPGAAGVKNATINVTSDDPTAATYKFNVKGTGINMPAIGIQGTSNTPIVTGDTTPATADGTDFGSADLVLGSVTKTYTIVNNGSAALTLTGNPLVSVTGLGKTAYTVVAQPTSSIAAGASATFQIKFAPGSTGQKDATVVIANNLGGALHPYTFAITGNAVSVPQIDVQGGTPATDLTSAQTAISTTDGTDFGTLDTASSSATHTFTIKDLGSGALHLSGAHVAISGADAADFSIVTPPANTTLSGKTTTRPAATPAKPAAAVATHKVGHSLHHYHTSHHTVSAVRTVGTPTPTPTPTPVPNSTTFAIKYDPSAVKANETATVTITSDDPNTGSFTFNIGGNAVSTSVASVTDLSGAVAIANGDTTPTAAKGTDFGSGDTTQQPLTTLKIHNTGSQDMTITGGLVLSDATDFTVVTDAPSSITAGQSAGVQIRFTPASAGVKTSTVTLNSDDPAGPYVFTIKGTATSSPVELLSGNNTFITNGDTTPSTADYTDFGNAELAQGFVTKTFQISNNGSAGLTISHIVIGGAAKTDFTVTANPTSPVAATSGQTTFTVKFKPTAAGVRAATITVQTNDPANPNFTYAVQGTGIRQPSMAVYGGGTHQITTGDTTPVVLDGTDFGTVGVSAPATHVFSVKNIGSDALDLGAITFTGTDAADFAVTQQPRVSLTSNATTTFNVTFTPTNAAAETATMNIPSDDPNTPFTVDLTGTGAAASLIHVKGGSGGAVAIASGDVTPVTTDGTDFGQAIINNASTSNTFVIASDGTIDLNLTGTPLVAISGTNAGDFSVSAMPTAAITHGQTSGFIVRFAPTAAGIRTATITIASDDPATPSYTFTVKGVGITAPAMSVVGNGNPVVDNETTPDMTNNTDFGDVELASGTVTETYTIRNTGSAPLLLNGTPIVRITGANAGDFTVVTQPANTVAAGATLTFQVKFKPSAVGQRNANVVIASNDNTTTPYTFAITGNAVQQPALTVSGAAGKVLVNGQSATTADGSDFGSAPANAGSVSRIFTIKNTGSAELDLSSLSVDGPDAADFTITQPTNTVLAAGATITFTVTFTPTGSGAENAVISIDSNDPNGAFAFSIKGTAA